MGKQLILPTPSEILQPALEKFYELRPNAFKHINLGEGVYSWVFKGWEAQIALELSRIGKLIKNNRRGYATGKDLAEYIASEFWEEPTLTEQTAMGSAVLTRSTGPLSGGIIRKGTRLHRNEDLNPPFFLTSADYETIEDAVFLPSQNTVTVKIKGTSAGTKFNTPLITSTATGLTISGNIFDDNITVSTYTAAGGSSPVSDLYLRLLAKYAATGKHGPSTAAAVLGALRAGARHVYPHFHSETAVLNLHIADESWASGASWCSTVKQIIHNDPDGIIGFGCRVDCEPVLNKVISIQASVTLRDHNQLSDTTEITNNIQVGLNEYLNNREDWYVWKSSGLKSAIIKSDFRILNCSSVTVKDSTGATLTEPTVSSDKLHYYLPNSGTVLTYSSIT